MAGSTGNQLIGKIALDIVDISKISIGNILIYSAGNIVTYHVDNGITYQEEVDSDETVLHPKTFSTVKEGWEFVGWRLDDVASSDILEELIMGDEPITLYAVFRQEITLSYDANGGSGSTVAQTGNRYYNGAGTYDNPSFVLSSSSFTAPSGYSFSKWAQGNASGDQYAAGTTVTLSENTIFYAVWTYAGNPFYIVQNRDPKQTLKWKATAVANTTYVVGSGTTWTPGGSIANLVTGYLDNGTAPSITWVSDPINAKGNKTVSITCTCIGTVYININNQTKLVTGGSSVTYTFDVSNVSSFSITASISNYGNSGNGGFQPVNIRVY